MLATCVFALVHRPPLRAPADGSSRRLFSAGSRRELERQGIRHLTAKIQGVEEAYTKAAASGFSVKAILIVNPNNPTGAVLSLDNIWKVDW